MRCRSEISPRSYALLALLAEGSPPSFKRAEAIISAASNSNNLPFCKTHSKLSERLKVMKGNLDPDELIFLTSGYDCSSQDPLEILIQAAAILWAKIEKNKRPDRVRLELEKRHANAKAAGYQWYATQAASILANYSGNTNSKTAPDSKIFGISLAGLIASRERWSEALNALLDVASPKTIKKVPSSASGPNFQRVEHEAKTIGIVLCSDKNDAMVRITLPDDNEQVIAARYQMYFPTEEELRAELEREREEAERELRLTGGIKESGNDEA